MGGQREENCDSLTWREPRHKRDFGCFNSQVLANRNNSSDFHVSRTADTWTVHARKSTLTKIMKNQGMREQLLVRLTKSVLSWNQSCGHMLGHERNVGSANTKRSGLSVRTKRKDKIDNNNNSSDKKNMTMTMIARYLYRVPMLCSAFRGLGGTPMGIHVSLSLTLLCRRRRRHFCALRAHVWCKRLTNTLLHHTALQFVFVVLACLLPIAVRS